MPKIIALFALLVLWCGPAMAARPLPEAAEAPLRVFVATYIRQVSKVNDQAETFEMTLDLRLRWKDPRLAFDIIQNGSERMVFNNEEAESQLKQMWTPEIVIRNLSSKPSRLEQTLFISADGSVSHLQRIKAQFEARFRLAAFPFDTQELPLRLSSTKYNNNLVTLTQEQADKDASGLQQGISVSGFRVLSLLFVPGRERGLSGELFQTLEARLKVERDPTAHLMAIFNPFLALLLIPTLLTLYARIDIGPRLTAWAGSILALIALNFTFSARFPTAGSDSLIGMVVSSGFAYQILMIVVSLVVLYPPVADKVSARLKNKYVVGELEGQLKWAIPIGFVAILITKVLLTRYAS